MERRRKLGGGGRGEGRRNGEGKGNGGSWGNSALVVGGIDAPRPLTCRTLAGAVAKYRIDVITLTAFTKDY